MAWRLLTFDVRALPVLSLFCIYVIGCADAPLEGTLTPLGGKSDIWGADDRVDSSNYPELAAARASAAMVVSSRLERQPDGTWRGNMPLLRDKKDLCEGEKFGLEPTLAYCSATLIAPDVVLTAGHCALDCAEMAVVFGYAYATPDADRGTLGTFAADQVYHCASVEAIEDLELDQGAEIDYAILRLDRAVTVAAPAKLAQPTDGEPVSVIGHPYGLPQKVAASTVALGPHVLFHHADTVGGVSGGGLFTSRNELIGVHFGGNGNGVEFDRAARCYRMASCGVNERYPCRQPNRAMPLSLIVEQLAEIGVSFPPAS